jgi:hypothetical protein
MSDFRPLNRFEEQRARAAFDRARAQGREYAKGLSERDKDAMHTSMVLGEFDWMDWFEDKPAPGFATGMGDYLDQWRQSQ